MRNIPLEQIEVAREVRSNAQPDARHTVLVGRLIHERKLHGPSNHPLWRPKNSSLLAHSSRLHICVSDPRKIA